MTTWNPRANDVFLQALDRPAGIERQRFLDEACADDPALRAEADALLDANAQAGHFLEAPPAVAHLEPLREGLLAERPGSVIGRYKLLEQIGEGGFGVVFMAEQQEPVRRKVALKVIKLGMDTRQVIARFEAERQALALMDHPNIAKVLDAGATDSGRPYFVMELIKGLPITEYCDQCKLTVRERLDLFIAVCQAVQHAHQKGIIHRDIKPTNVLVTLHDGTPVVKVIDFGIAKATGQQLTEKTLFTNFAQMIGTPLYMSPEQAALGGLDIDTRSDIYSLGVLLYELLTGTTPFDKELLRTAAYDEIRRIIREEEPPKPSTRVSTLDKSSSAIFTQRKSNPADLSRFCRGELDWIAMRSLEKDRNRRYESASAFAADIERYLKDEPVHACPPSHSYLLRKYLRRHRTGLAIALASLTAALVIAVGTALAVVDRANRRVEVDRQRAAIEKAVDEDLKEAARFQQQEQWGDVRNALERAQGRLAESGLEELQARVEQRRLEMGVIAKLEEARILSLPMSSLGSPEDNARASDGAYASAFAKLDLDVAVLAPEDAAQRIRKSAIHGHLLAALDHWVFVKEHLPGANAKALQAIVKMADDNAWRKRLREIVAVRDRKALERLADEEAVLDQPPANLLVLGEHLNEANCFETAERLLRRAQQRYPGDFRLNFDLGMILGNQRGNRGEEHARDAVGFFRAALALQPRRPHVYIYLADALGNQGVEFEPEAHAACRAAIELKRDFGLAYLFLGNGLSKVQKFAEAEPMYCKVIDLNADDFIAWSGLVSSLRHQRKFVEANDAAKQLKNAVAANRRKLGPVYTESPKYYFLLGKAYANAELHEDAAEAFKRMSELEPNNQVAPFLLGKVLRDSEQFSKAELAFLESIRRGRDDSEIHYELGSAYERQKKLAEAEESFRKAISLDPSNVEAHNRLGNFFFRLGKFDEAEPEHREAVRLSPMDPLILTNFGHVRFFQGKLAEAEDNCRKAIKVAPDYKFAYEVLALALHKQQKHLETVRVFRDAHRRKVPNLDLYNAACSAAILGCGKCQESLDLKAEERAQFRKEAIHWLRICLSEQRDKLVNNKERARASVRDYLDHWKNDPDLEAIRSSAALSTLPDAERVEWQQFWDEVDTSRQLASSKTGVLNKSKSK